MRSPKYVLIGVCKAAIPFFVVVCYSLTAMHFFQVASAAAGCKPVAMKELVRAAGTAARPSQQFESCRFFVTALHLVSVISKIWPCGMKAYAQ